jgi:hypothetical protein
VIVNFNPLGTCTRVEVLSAFYIDIVEDDLAIDYYTLYDAWDFLLN